MTYLHRASILADILGDDRMFGTMAGVHLDALTAEARVDLQAYSPDQERGSDGRWSAGGAEAAAGIAKVLGGERTAAAHAELLTHLGKMTTKDLNQVKKQYGLKASGPNKAALAAKLHEKLAAGHWTGAKGAQTAATPEPSPKKGDERQGWKIIDVVAETHPHTEVDVYSGKSRLTEHREELYIAEHPEHGGWEMGRKEWDSLKEPAATPAAPARVVKVVGNVKLSHDANGANATIEHATGGSLHVDDIHALATHLTAEKAATPKPVAAKKAPGKPKAVVAPQASAKSSEVVDSHAAALKESLGKGRESFSRADAAKQVEGLKGLSKEALHQVATKAGIAPPRATMGKAAVLKHIENALTAGHRAYESIES